MRSDRKWTVQARNLMCNFHWRWLNNSSEIQCCRCPVFNFNLRTQMIYIISLKSALSFPTTLRVRTKDWWREVHRGSLSLESETSWLNFGGKPGLIVGPWCVYASWMGLPRMVLASLELVLRVASQNRSHEEININTFKKRGEGVLGKGEKILGYNKIY